MLKHCLSSIKTHTVEREEVLFHDSPVVLLLELLPNQSSWMMDDNTNGAAFYYEDNKNDQQLLQQQQQNFHRQQERIMNTMPRSIPISINDDDGDADYDYDYDDDAVDADDGVIDVEGDAIKLRRKYGNKIVQTYHQDSSILSSSSIFRRSYVNANTPSSSSLTAVSVLNAPYLGSLSKSTNQILSLPPMSLAGGDMSNDQVEEPPESVISYGSLRDSHDRGQFLDGPSSYREPMSGKIRQLDHRLRYYGRQPELNIGERMQQSMKRKELRQKEESKNQINISNNTDQQNNNDSADYDREDRDRSSLSAMMDKAPQTQSDSILNANVNAGTNENIFLPEFQSSPIEKNSTSRMMLSTSLTAFELLKTSNTDNNAHSHNKQRYSGREIAESDKSAPGASHNILESNQTAGISQSHSQNGFQFLSRSMSDPSPRFDHRHSQQFPTLTTTVTTSLLSSNMQDIYLRNNQIEGFSTSSCTAKKDAILRIDHQQGNHHHLQQQQQGTFLCNGNAQQYPLSASAFTSSVHASSVHDDAAIFNGHESRSSHLDHDPNTDGAFGDMDME